MRGSLRSPATAISAVLLLPALLGMLASCVMQSCSMEGAAAVVAMDGLDCCPQPGATLESPCCIENPAVLAVPPISPEKPRTPAFLLPQLPVPPALAERDRASALYPLSFRRLDCLSQSCVLRI